MRAIMVYEGVNDVSDYSVNDISVDGIASFFETMWNLIGNIFLRDCIIISETDWDKKDHNLTFCYYFSDLL